jgi:hypothetical protein
MKTKGAEKEPLPSTLPERIRSELNVEKWSIWQPASSRTAPKARKLEREFTLPDGGRLVAKVEMVPTTRGNLTTEDQRVYSLGCRSIIQPPDRVRRAPRSLRGAPALRGPWGQIGPCAGPAFRHRGHAGRPAHPVFDAQSARRDERCSREELGVLATPSAGRD